MESNKILRDPLDYYNNFDILIEQDNLFIESFNKFTTSEQFEDKLQYNKKDKNFEFFKSESIFKNDDKKNMINWVRFNRLPQFLSSITFLNYQIGSLLVAAANRKFKNSKDSFLVKEDNAKSVSPSQSSESRKSVPEKTALPKILEPGAEKTYIIESKLQDIDNFLLSTNNTPGEELITTWREIQSIYLRPKIIDLENTNFIEHKKVLEANEAKRGRHLLNSNTSVSRENSRSRERSKSKSRNNSPAATQKSRSSNAEPPLTNYEIKTEKSEKIKMQVEDNLHFPHFKSIYSILQKYNKRAQFIESKSNNFGLDKQINFENLIDLSGNLAEGPRPHTVKGMDFQRKIIAQHQTEMDLKNAGSVFVDELNDLNSLKYHPSNQQTNDTSPFHPVPQDFEKANVDFNFYQPTQYRLPNENRILLGCDLLKVRKLIEKELISYWLPRFLMIKKDNYEFIKLKPKNLKNEHQLVRVWGGELISEVYQNIRI